MDIVLILLPLSTMLAALFAWMFVRAVRNGQFDDLEDARWRVLNDEEPQPTEPQKRTEPPAA